MRKYDDAFASSYLRARVRTLYPSNARPKVRPRRRRVGSLARLQRRAPPLEDAPSGSRAASPGSALSPNGASSRHTGAPPYSSARSQPVRIGNCDVRRGRTSPPDDCVQTPVTWRRTQSSITKYVLDTEGASSRTDSRENSFPSYLSKAGGEIHHRVKCVPRHTCVIWSHTPQAPNLIP